MPRRFKLICAFKKGEAGALSDSQVFGRLQIAFRIFSSTLLEQMSWGICWKYPLLMVSKRLKLERASQEAGGGVRLLAHQPLPFLQMEALDLSCLWACCHWLFFLVTGSSVPCFTEFLLYDVFGADTSLLLNLNVPRSCFCLSQPEAATGANRW